ncbi:polyketide synthase docking domain-containing protein, partial [Micromonospora antibiotica]
MGRVPASLAPGKACPVSNSEDKFREYLKRATVDLRQTRARLAEVEEQD